MIFRLQSKSGPLDICQTRKLFMNWPDAGIFNNTRFSQLRILKSVVFLFCLMPVTIQFSQHQKFAV